MRMSARGALVAVIAARCVDTGIARLLAAFVGLTAAIGRAMLARAAGSAAPRRGMAFIADIAACGHRDHPFHVVRGAVMHHATYDTAVQSGGWLWPANWAFAANAGQSRVATTAARRGWPGRAADWRGLFQGVETPHLDRGYYSVAARRLCADASSADIVCPQRHAPPGGAGLRPVPSAGAGASNAPLMAVELRATPLQHRLPPPATGEPNSPSPSPASPPPNSSTAATVGTQAPEQSAHALN